MSLDVYLKTTEPVVRSGSGIFVRESGATKEISREEWDAKHPNLEPFFAVFPDPTHVVFHANITHNLGEMAAEAHLYTALWRPDEHCINKAKQLIDILKEGLAELQSDPERFKALNPSNGWGTYDGLVAFVRGYLAACETYPDADVEVSR